MPPPDQTPSPTFPHISSIHAFSVLVVSLEQAFDASRAAVGFSYSLALAIALFGSCLNFLLPQR